MSEITLPEQYKFLFLPRRYKVMYSGRAAGKSWSVAFALMIQGLQSPMRILCTRELQNSITDSVHKLLTDINDKYNLGYTVTNTSIYHPNGTEFMFYGLRTNITKIKSLEGVDICWIEEAETISKESLKVLVPTIRKKNSEIWITFNPYAEDDAVYKEFVIPYADIIADNGVYVDQRHYVLKTSYKDNPFLPETIQDEITSLKANNYAEYRHVYGGEPTANDENCIIKPEWFDAVIDAHEKLNFKSRGLKSIGFDPADQGSDAKASIRTHGSVVTSINQWTTGDLNDAVEQVYNEALEHGVNEIVFDAIGVGAGAKLKFKQYDPKETLTITAFVAGHTPDSKDKLYKEGVANRDMFRNKRTQYYWLLRDRFEATYRAVTQKEYIDPSELISISSECEYLDELKAELTKIRRKRSGTNSVVQIESKQDMKQRGIASPNLADALVYAFATKDDSVIGGAVLAPPNINFVSNW